MPSLKKSFFHRKDRLIAAAILTALGLLTAFWVFPTILPKPLAVKPSIGPIQPTTGYYLTFNGNISRIFVLSANVSSGRYPFVTRTSEGIINGKPAGKVVVTKGEPCVVINVTLRNDYSAQNPPPYPNPLPGYPGGAYVLMTSEIFRGSSEINSTDLTNLDMPPSSWSFVWLNGGGTGTLSIYLATASHEEITAFRLDAIYIGGIFPG